MQLNSDNSWYSNLLGIFLLCLDILISFSNIRTILKPNSQLPFAHQSSRFDRPSLDGPWYVRLNIHLTVTRISRKHVGTVVFPRFGHLVPRVRKSILDGGVTVSVLSKMNCLLTGRGPSFNGLLVDGVHWLFLPCGAKFAFASSRRHGWLGKRFDEGLLKVRFLTFEAFRLRFPFGIMYDKMWYIECTALYLFEMEIYSGKR